MASTSAGAGILCDQACVESINNVTPLGANVFVLNALGQTYGVQQGVGSNASVYCVFTGSVGFVIPIGFTVSDGAHQYTVQDGGIVLSGGSSSPLFCLATQSGNWAIPANSVTTLITSIPGSVTLAVTNPNAGTPSNGPQTVEDYRAQVLQAGQSVAQGMTTYLRKQIQAVPGVQSRLVSVRAYSTGWEVIVGGNGDPYAIANGIFIGLFNINTLLPSNQGVVYIAGISNANPAVVNAPSHTYTNGEAINISGVLGMTGVNGGPYNVTVTDSNHFSIPIDTTAAGSYLDSVVTNAVWANTAGGQTTFTTSTDLSGAVTAGTTIVTSGIASTGGTGVGYNGTFTAVSATSTTVVVTQASASSPGTYSSGGMISGKAANTVTNETVTINDYPDSYNIPFVVPPLQTVSIGLTWNTTAANYVSDAAVAALGAPALVSYVNSITVGAPMNLFELQNAFQLATAGVIPTAQLTRMVFTVEINGVTVTPDAGTGIIQGDSESYLYTSTTNISIARG
jgi:hypothetical protein